MKLICLVGLLMLPLLAQAQSVKVDGSSETSLTQAARTIKIETFDLPGASYDRIVRGRVTYSGIGVQMVRSPQLYQVVNPLAPKKYGSGAQNLVVDPLTKQPVGLKFFAIKF